MKKSVRDPALKGVIQGEIKKIITTQKLRAGDFLPPEGQLADNLGVSRGSVREAVKALESLGIVESRHGEGVCVREFNFDAVLDFLSYGLVFQPSRAPEILQIREWLEASALILACQTISEATLNEMDTLLCVWEGKAQQGKVCPDEDRRFHHLLYSALNNTSLLSLIDVFWVVYHSLDHSNLPQDHDPLRTVSAHRSLFEAVRARDAQLAQQRLGQHFRNIEQRIQRSMEGI